MAQRKLGVSLKPGKARAALTITHPNAAGIDIGAMEEAPVEEFAEEEHAAEA